MNNALSEAEAAAAAAIAAQQVARGTASALGVSSAAVRRYAKYRSPGVVASVIFYDPCSMLKDADARRASGDQYIWRKPDDPVTKNMVLRGVLKPVMVSEIDPHSPYANVDRARIITKEGPREVVRSPKGLGLFVAKAGEHLSPVDQAQLPGEQWEAQYFNDVNESKNQFSADLEQLSSSSLEGRINMEQSGLSEKDVQREQVV